MNKLINTLSLFLLSVMTFANDNIGDPTGPSGDLQGHDTAGGDPTLTPIDNYTFALIALAVIMIAYVVYKQRQSKIA